MTHNCPGLNDCDNHPKWSVTKERTIWVVNVPRTGWCLGAAYLCHPDALRAAMNASKEKK